MDFQPAESAVEDLGKADLILCAGIGIGSEEYWKKLHTIADALNGAVGCTRPVVDAGWGAEESCMIGTSGISVRPKVYVGFGISGASHHLCGIKDAGTIVSVNSDRDADMIKASDHVVIDDAQKVIDQMIAELCPN